LAIEVELPGAVLAKLDTYAAIGFSEVWRYIRGKVQFHVLDATGKYEQVERSSTFPLLTTTMMDSSVKRWQNEMDDTAGARTFLAEIKKLRKKS